MKDAEPTASISVVFFDVRDTLGEVDSPGHLVPYRPSTEQLLDTVKALGVTIGAITNLPGNPDNPKDKTLVTDQQGRDMICNAILSVDERSGATTTIGKYIARDHIVTNHEASKALGKKGVNKPAPAIYQYAAKKLGVDPGQCLFIGENLSEVIGARVAGMRGQIKQCPPGRDFAPALVGPIGSSAVDSGRQFEALLKHEHLLGERIFACGDAIGAALRPLVQNPPPLDRGRWVSPPKVTVPKKVKEAMAYYVYLINRFADQIHLQAEEAMLEVAVACGMDPVHGQWVLAQHAQARAYWQCLNVAWKRIEAGDDDDRFYAIGDFQRAIDGFVFLFKAHAIREDYQTYPMAGGFFNDTDDAMVLNLLEHFGPADITPYVGMVGRMEALLGVQGG